QLSRAASRRMRVQDGILARLAWAGMVVLAIIGAVQMEHASRGLEDDGTLGMMDFVKDHGSSGQVFFVPPDWDMADFRLYTGVPIVVDWKPRPYRDVELLEWYRRVLV